MIIKELLADNPSLPEILVFIEVEAQRIAAERKKAAGQAKAGRKP